MNTLITDPTQAPPVERQVAADMVRRSVPFVPVLVLLAAAGWGFDGAASAAFAIGIVLVNLTVSAALLSWAGRISLGVLMATALFGYLLRLGAITAAVLLVREQPWVNLWPLGLAIIVTHLGLLLWETRYVSATLAYPGLRPSEKE